MRVLGFPAGPSSPGLLADDLGRRALAPGASVILAFEEWMEPRCLSPGADVSMRWDKAHTQGMARAQEATIFNFLSVIIIRSACEEEGRRPPGDPHCHGFISWPQGLGDGPPRTVGTSAKWLLGSRKAEGKCCLRLFDLWVGGCGRGWGRRVGNLLPPWKVGWGLRTPGHTSSARCPLSLGQMHLSLSVPLPPALSVLTCSQGRATP